MDESQQLKRPEFGYCNVEINPGCTFSTDCTRRPLAVPHHYCSQNEGSVIKQTYFQATSNNVSQIPSPQVAEKCIHVRDNSSVPVPDCVQGSCSVIRISEVSREPERIVITPDSTDMVTRTETSLPGGIPAGMEPGDAEKIQRTGTKPPMSYIGLISKAILQSPDRRMNLGAIYSWMEASFPYFRQNSRGWRNSVRHNLSLNDCFIKAGRCEDGKGNYWTIHPENLEDFIRGDFRLRRRSRRRGRKAESSRTEGVVKAGYQPTQNGCTPGQVYLPAPMSTPVSFPAGQQYILQDPSSVPYQQAYNPTYGVYESGSPPHGPSLPQYAAWTHPQSGEQCVEMIVPPPGHNYSHNPAHLYGYTNYSYPSYGYQSAQW